MRIDAPARQLFTPIQHDTDTWAVCMIRSIVYTSTQLVLPADGDIFIITDVPSKGKGILAARPLKRGELILAESPLFTQTSGYSSASVVAALGQLSREDQRAFFSLSNAFPELPPPLGVWITNSFPCWSPEDPTGDTAHTAGVFLTASRFNSSCHPNVYHYLDPNLRQMVFRAATDIAPGEELCITYAELFATRDERRAELQRSFRFTCHCVACARTGEDLKRSDDRRTRVADIFNELPYYRDDPVMGLRKVLSVAACDIRPSTLVDDHLPGQIRPPASEARGPDRVCRGVLLR